MHRISVRLCALLFAGLVPGLAEAESCSHDARTIMRDVQVQAEATETSEIFALRISAMVMLGTNGCRAEGYTVSLNQRPVAHTIHVTGMKSGSNFNICPPDFAPVFGRAEIVVRGYVDEIEDVVLENVERMGRSLSARSLLRFPLQGLRTQTIIRNTSVTAGRVMHEANTMELRVRGLVLAGENGCRAEGVTIELEKRLVGDVLHLRYMRVKSREAAAQICPPTYEPILQRTDNRVRVNTRGLSDIVIDNVDSMRHNVSIWQLMDD